MFNLLDIGLISPHESIYHQRCNDIKEQLKEYDVIANVSRHNFKDKEYYCLNVDLNHNNSHITISDALNISKDEIHFIHINLKEDYKIYWISEEYLHSLYLINNNLNFDIDKYKDEALKYLDNPDYYVESININNPSTVDLVLKKKKNNGCVF